jgi:hypothetical protein
MPTVKEILYGDVGYAGADTDPSIFSLDYYRNKVREFQDSLNRTAAIAEAFEAMPVWALDDTSRQEINSWLSDYYARRAWIIEAANGVNLLAQGANAVGIRFPVVSVPTGLNALPPLLAIAGIAALTAIVAVVEWSATKQAQAKLIADQITLIATVPEDQRAALLTGIQNVQNVAAQGSISATIANSLKWIVIAAGVFVAGKLLLDRKD